MDAGMSDDLNVDGAGAADGRLVDPGFLVNADPDEVLGLVDAASGPAARLAGAVYRESAYLHRDAGTGVRRQLLALDAARFGDRELAARITSVPVEGKPDAWWAVEWATSSTIHLRFQHALPGHADTVSAVATEVVEGRPVAVVADGSETVRVWDLATGRPVGEPFATGGVATAVMEGRSVAVTGSRDGTVRVWDLATGRTVGEFLTDHTGPIHVEATAVMEGRPVVVAEHDNKTVRVWDLATGRPIGEPITGHTYGVWAVATEVVEGRPVAVVADGSETVRVWDLATGRPVGEPLTGHTEPVRVVATGVVDGRPVAVTGSSDETVRVWDLATGRPGRSWCFPWTWARWLLLRMAGWWWGSAGMWRCWPATAPCRGARSPLPRPRPRKVVSVMSNLPTPPPVMTGSRH
ncbi:hypothetical protein [Streptomyces sp. NPDC088766]|uniref:hypothetical protein n=1 Tax=Streptomyces sp. NPDC088766 TaxID=3365893 RepID=UPI0038146974